MTGFKRLTILGSLAVAVGVGLVLLGLVSYRPVGICFGLCEQNRRETFDRIFPQWFAHEAECGQRGATDRDLIAFLYPALLSDVDSKNQNFAELAERERDGSLSLGERDRYLNDTWRVILTDQSEFHRRDIRSIIPPELPYDTTSTLIRRCPENGLVNADYCEDLVSVPLRTSSKGYARPNALPIHHWAYVHLRDTGELDRFIDRMEADSVRDYDLRRAAEAKVLTLPASDFPLENSPLYEVIVKNRVEQIYLQSRCE